MNRKQKKQIAGIAKKVAKRVIKEEIGRIKKQLVNEIKQEMNGGGGVPQRQPQPRQQQQQPQQQPQRPSQAQPAGQGNSLSQFKQIQESVWDQGVNPAGEGGPMSGGGGQGTQMSEREMVQYAENLDPNGASPNMQPDPTGGTIQQGQNESRQQFMQRLQQATGGKDPKQVFEQSEKKSGSGGWRPGMDED